ncbi:hypothetical protein [Clostridioides difficile]|nr:hypothetical protein [Clostridioides difficile]EQF93276.1 hypothetical protein QGW_0992 [Clostridioides difficile 824]EQK57367.1 hypothetical protein C676_3595 [Clostridioides difficile F548]MCC8848076.1 hypothetical protein [Clostridioides difficile]MCE0658022.1 hypothetical protein [Clostridioides difficile]MCE4757641.1 hypothetical protein [Clostridioides difficile]
MEEEYRKFFLERNGEKIEMVQNCEGAIKISLNNIKTDNSHRPWNLKAEGTATVTLYLGKLLFEEMLWLKILYLLEVIAEKMMMGVLGMIIIRSQNKLDLMRVNRVEIDSRYVYAVFEGESNVREIGRYKSEERAIEVLNRIQEAIIAGTKFDIINKDGVRCNKEKVFEMPVE